MAAPPVPWLGASSRAEAALSVPVWAPFAPGFLRATRLLGCPISLPFSGIGFYALIYALLTTIRSLRTKSHAMGCVLRCHTSVGCCPLTSVWSIPRGSGCPQCEDAVRQDGDAKSLFSFVSHLPGWKVIYQSGSIVNCLLEKQAQVETQSMPLMHALFPGAVYFSSCSTVSTRGKGICQPKAISAL